MIEPSGFCADLEFALACVRGDLGTWFHPCGCTYTLDAEATEEAKYEALMCFIYELKHLVNNLKALSHASESH